MVKLSEELGLGYGNIYTRLGKAAAPKQISMVGTVLGSDRTFCNLPSKMAAGEWKGNVNDAAPDETTAHTSKSGFRCFFLVQKRYYTNPRGV